MNSLLKKYIDKIIRVSTNNIYLNYMITCTNQGSFEEFDNELLEKEMEFYNGILEIFRELKNLVQNNQKYKEFIFMLSIIL